MGQSVFISFRSLDRDTVLPLYNRLQEDGIQVFMSSENLEDGDVWASRLAQEMKASDLMLAFITEAYLSQQFQVDKEWYLANELQKPTLPVLYRVEKGAIPHDWAYITKMQYLPISELRDKEIEEIVAKCKRSLEKGKVFLDSPRAVFENAKSLSEKGEWGKAISLYEKVSDDIPEAYPAIVYCRLMMRQARSARDAAREALTHCPDMAETYFYAAMANLAGRDDYPPKLLERAAEQLIRAWSVEPKLSHCYLAICIAYLYNDQSFRIPQEILELVRIGQEHTIDQDVLNSFRHVLGI